MLKGGISEPRNKTIMKMFNLIRVGERAGSGVPDIFSVWEEEGWLPPTVEELYKPDRTVLTLVFTKKQAEKTSGKRKKQAESGNGKAADNKELIVAFVEERRKAKTAEIADAIGLSQPRIRVLLSELIEEGRIEPEGVGRARVYVLKK